MHNTLGMDFLEYLKHFNSQHMDFIDGKLLTQLFLETGAEQFHFHKVPVLPSAGLIDPGHSRQAFEFGKDIHLNGKTAFLISFINKLNLECNLSLGCSVDGLVNFAKAALSDLAQEVVLEFELLVIEDLPVQLRLVFHDASITILIIQFNYSLFLPCNRLAPWK